ncbi:MAG: RNA polymerase sigma-70 factor (ECF subfamily) [Pirellulaceae bacterium]
MDDGDKKQTEGMIITAVLAGESDQFALLVQQYQRVLLRVAASRLGRQDLAEDVVQETFLAAFKSLHTYDSRFSFRTWLWTILLNQCRRTQKKRMRHPLVQSWGDQQTETDTSPELHTRDESPVNRLLNKEQSQQLDRMLNQLPQQNATSLRLRFFAGLKFHEIATAMKCSLSSAKIRVRQGLIQLADLIGEQPNQLSTNQSSSTHQPSLQRTDTGPDKEVSL